MTDRIIYELTGHTNPTDLLTLADGEAVFAAVGSSAVITPQKYGAVADGVTDDSAAFVAAIAFLHAFALNDGSVNYKGSPKLFIPAGNYYLGTTALDITHTLIIEGEGSGQFGPGSFGCTHLRWADGADGIRFQAANTSGNTAFDNVTIHDGSGGGSIRDLCLEGGFGGTTESDHHGLVIRNAIKAERLYIKNWPGEAVKAWAGNVPGQASVSGNVSSTMLVSIKTERNRGGIDIRGSDANVVTTINCEGYQNRLFGLIDDAGGANTHIGWHCADNGIIGGPLFTQCSYAGNYYALVWGGDPTIAPSGTTADTANWYYILAGAPIAGIIPTWVSTPGTFAAGGDYLNPAGSALFLNCYSETGGFSQFGSSTTITDGVMTEQYFRGGGRTNTSASYGFRFVQGPDAAFTIQHRNTQGGFIVQDELNVAHSQILFGKTSGNFHKARDVSGHVFQTAPYNGTSTTRCSITGNGLELPASHSLYVNSLQVVGARQTGTAANATDLATAITLVNDLKTKLIAHGLIS